MTGGWWVMLHVGWVLKWLIVTFCLTFFDCYKLHFIAFSVLYSYVFKCSLDGRDIRGVMWREFKRGYNYCQPAGAFNVQHMLCMNWTGLCCTEWTRVWSITLVYALSPCLRRSSPIMQLSRTKRLQWTTSTIIPILHAGEGNHSTTNTTNYTLLS